MKGDLRITLVTALCILILAVLSRWILGVELDLISLYAPVWVYMGYVITRGRPAAARTSPNLWSLVIVMTTFAVAVIHALA